ncbi:diacylglycerol kinase family enzyme [Peptoniphilus olsenii]|uniref:Diacylglycerol kinase family enzyme n=1 Tax=Peptoniphilus olsenii TaxID=411570 RepID=A0ABV2J8M2_9FIRM
MDNLIVISSKSGRGRYKKLEEELLKVYKPENIKITENSEDIKNFAKDFIKRGEGVFLLCGGDGSLAEAAEVLRGTNTAMGLIPFGTGNDFSKNFNYNNFRVKDTLVPTIKPIDLIEVNGKICVNVLSLGFDTNVLVHAYDLKKKYPFLGKSTFLYGVIKSLMNIEYTNLEIKLVDNLNREIKIEDEFLISALCNGSYYGSGFQPAPFAKLDDGLLNLVTAPRFKLKDIIPLLYSYRKGTHLKDEKIKEFLVKSGEIKSDKEFIYNIDGEIYKTKELKFKVLEKNLKWAYF